jgi:hypothetical protein
MSAMTRFTEWLGRVIMLVLAGMVTLSLIGAIASIPSGSIETRLGVEPRQDWPEPRASERSPVPEQEQASSAPAPQPEAQSPRHAGEMVAVPAPPPPADPARWLEAITYALLALVGLMALGMLLLWRALHHWRRSADALEALALRGSS